MDKEIYIQEDIGLAKSCLKYDTNEKVIERGEILSDALQKWNARNNNQNTK